MGTTGTIIAISTYLKAKNPAIQIEALNPAMDLKYPELGLEEYLPKIFDADKVDQSSKFQKKHEP
jgi:cysteine synthase B